MLTTISSTSFDSPNLDTASLLNPPCSLYFFLSTLMGPFLPGLFAVASKKLGQDLGHLSRTSFSCLRVGTFFASSSPLWKKLPSFAAVFLFHVHLPLADPSTSCISFARSSLVGSFLSASGPPRMGSIPSPNPSSFFSWGSVFSVMLHGSFQPSWPTPLSTM